MRAELQNIKLLLQLTKSFPPSPVHHKHDTTKYSVDSPFHVVCAVNVIFSTFIASKVLDKGCKSLFLCL